MLKTQPAVAALGLTCICSAGSAADPEPRSWIAVRGIYGGVPEQLLRDGKRLADYGVNAVWLGSGSASAENLARLRGQDVKVFAEFNTLHVASYIEDHPDAAPVGTDGQPCPPPHGWQGVSPTHEGYRKFRMDAFSELLANYAIDGVWLDYHHSHASWERAEPVMPDTGFDPRSLVQFQRDTGINLPDAPTPELAKLLLGEHKEAWVEWRCDVLTDWVRELREILDATRPGALLGTFHCPWTEEERDGALRNKLHIDLKAQAKYIDIFSPMPYHARFGHGDDPAWISRQVEWLGRYLGIEGTAGEKHAIWPIVQLADWEEPPVPAEQVREVLDHGTRRPATGVTVFHYRGLGDRPDKVAELARFYLDIRP